MLRFITSPSRLGLLIMLITVLAFGVFALPDRHRSPNEREVEQAVQEPAAETDSDIDYAEVSTEVSPPPVDARLVGQLAEGMRTIKKRRDGGLWGFCGELLSDEQQVETSIAIAYHIVVNMQSVGLDNVSPWGIVSTAYNESGFDACALGIGPRRWAYREGLLRPRKQFLSHTHAEVLNVVKSKRARQQFALTGFDLGFCQVLTRFHPGQEEEMLTTAGGARICVLEMGIRAKRHKTTRPWLFWPGSETSWYRKKIHRWGRIMGAPTEKGII